ncbi:unnamed protein product [Caenorhabditis sp. 36 PRJEB53466]|nr:unnamed protein product [Caenorhabditis sp. 36 PRJEB53466]
MCLFVWISWLLSLAQLAVSMTMLTFSGEISDVSNCSKVHSSIWRKAIVGCGRSTACMMAYSTGEAYYYCDYQALAKVSLAKGSADIIAIKINLDELICPPTFNGLTGNVTETLAYTLSLIDEALVFNYYSAYECADGWQLFERDRAPWCLQVVGGPRQLYTQQEARDACTNARGMLSGLESRVEALWTAGIAAQFVVKGQAPKDLVSVWIDGKRTDFTDVQSANVSQRVQQYEFTDPNLNLSSWMRTSDAWSPTQPSADIDQVCIQMRASKLGRLDEHTKLDNWKCDTPKAGADDLFARAALCGRFATEKQ